MIFLYILLLFTLLNVLIAIALFIFKIEKHFKFIKWWSVQFKDIYTLIKELVTFVIGSSVFLIYSILGWAYSLGLHLWLKDFSLKKFVSPIVRVFTLLFDGLANALGGELLNHFLKPKIKFGKWWQTISAITGINYLHNKKYGITNKKIDKFRNILNKILGKNHCENAITDNDRVYYKL